MMVIAPEGADVDSMLEALVDDGVISGWEASPLVGLRNAVTGEVVGDCPLAELAMVADDEEIRKARHFWDGAIAQDGSIPPSVLRVMRIDDEARDAYVRRYGDAERYVTETTAVHADAVLLPDGSFRSNDDMRGRNQLHDWSVGFVDRFLRPLSDGEADVSDGRRFVAHAVTYKVA